MPDLTGLYKYYCLSESPLLLDSTKFKSRHSSLYGKINKITRVKQRQQLIVVCYSNNACHNYMVLCKMTL